MSIDRSPVYRYAPEHAVLVAGRAPIADEAAPAPPAPDASSVADPALPQVDEDLIALAADLAPGKALDLGCGVGQDCLWLARRGWTITGVDPSSADVEEARRGAQALGLRLVFEAADVTAWRPVSRFDLVTSTFALPARGMGRSRLLETAAAAVAPGGTILVSELDASLGRDGWMEQRYLVSLDEILRHLDGFRIDRSAVRLRRLRHGYEERVLPVATVVATRRTDLRTL